jgi:hypothetical protein
VGRNLSELTVVDFEELAEFLGELAVPEDFGIPTTSRQPFSITSRVGQTQLLEFV